MNVHYLPMMTKVTTNGWHQNKGGYILNMNTFQRVNHGVLQFVSHLFFKQVQKQTILDQIDYSRWVHIFIYQ